MVSHSNEEYALPSEWSDVTILVSYQNVIFHIFKIASFLHYINELTSPSVNNIKLINES